MPRRRRRNVQNRRPVRRITSRRPRQSAATRQRNANSKAINTLVKQVYLPRQYQLQQNGQLTQYTHIYPIVMPDEYAPVFQNYNTTVSTAVGSQYHMSGVKTRWLMQPESIIEGTSDVWAQVFIVSLKPFQSRKFRANNLQLTANYHFSYAPLDTVAGLAYGYTHIMLNRQIFNIHYSSGQRRMGNTTLLGEEVTTIQDTAIYGNTYTPWKKTIKGDTAAQMFQDMSKDDIRDSAQLYVLIFSNAQEDSPLFYSFNHLIYGSSTRGL